MNLVDPIFFQCRINGEQPAICAPGTRFDLLTYAQLEYMVNNLTRAARSLRLEPGQIVGILLQDRIFHIALILALTRIGVVTVSCRGHSLPAELKATAIITDKPDVRATGVDRVIAADLEWVQR